LLLNFGVQGQLQSLAGLKSHLGCC
jgi:hypothetical protein